MIVYGVDFIIVSLVSVSIKSEEKKHIWKDQMRAEGLCRNVGINAS